MKSGRTGIPALVIQACFIATTMMAWQVAAKTTRDSLFLSAYDPVQALPPMMVAASVASVLMAVLSAKLLHKWGPSLVIPIGFLFGAGLHIAEYLLLPEFPGPVAIAIYIHVVAIGSVLLSGFWALANERFDPRQARKRFGQIAAFGTVGVLVGGIVTERVSKLISTPSLLIMLAGLQLVVAIALFPFAPRKSAPKQHDAPSLPEMISGAPYLVGLAAFVLLAAMSASSLDYLFKTTAKMNFAKGAPLTGFLALFNTVSAVLTFGLQVGGSKMWLKRFGPGKTVATLPVAVTSVSVAAMFAPGLVALTVSRAVELLLRGSLYRSGYELFYTPMPAAEKRSLKGVIDVGAERLGDGLAGAAIKLLAMLPGSSNVILGFTALLSAGGAWLAYRLDHAYVKVLEKGLVNHTVAMTPDQAEDSVTHSVVLKTMATMAARGPMATVPEASRSIAAEPAPITDPVLRRLAELRSGDTKRMLAALQKPDTLEPVVVPQVIELLDRDDVAQTAYTVLVKAGDRVAGQLVDALQNPSSSYNIRKRLPKVLASSQSRLAWDGLIAHLGDDRFEVRTRCAKALERILAKKPEFRPQNEVIFEAIQEELATTRRLTLTGQESQSSGVGDALKDRAAKSIAHIFTLLGLVLPPQPVRLAFRALRAEDGRLKGVALEYLDSVLPHSLREQLSSYFEGTLTAPKVEKQEEALAKLLESSPSIMMKATGLPGGPPKRGSTIGG